MPTTATFHVEGMSCSHCVGAIESEVATVDGVTAVDVDLATGRLTVGSEAPVDPAAVAAAVVDAGYEVSS